MTAGKERSPIVNRPTPEGWQMAEAAAACVPSNWCDPLLTGPEKVADFKDGPAIERLLNAIRKRILALSAAPPTEPCGGWPSEEEIARVLYEADHGHGWDEEMADVKASYSIAARAVLSLFSNHSFPSSPSEIKD